MQDLLDTRERPFECPHCQIKFPRADVRDKHIRRFHAPPGMGQPRLKKTAAVQQRRSKHACDHCRKGKLRCDEQRPCNSCWTRDLPCTSSGVRKPSERPRNSAVGADTLAHQTSSPGRSEVLLNNDVSHPEHSDSLMTNTSPYTTTLNGPEIDILTNMDASYAATSVIPVDQDSTPLTEKGQNLPLSTIETPFAPIVGLGFDEAGLTEWNEGDFPLVDEIWELPLQVRSCLLGFVTVLQAH